MASGTDSVALVASQNENTLQQENAENSTQHKAGVKVSLCENESASSYLPVFEAFLELGLTGADLAQITDVTPPTVSKWRSGKIRIPEERLVFLTLILAHVLEDAVALCRLEYELESTNGAGDWCTTKSARIDAARAYLTLQDVLNKDVAVKTIRESARQFRIWWASGAAQKLQKKRFSLALDGGAIQKKDAMRELNMLMARKKRS